MSATPLKTLGKIPFKNVHTESVPAFGVIEVSGSVVEDGVTFLTGTKPGTVLGNEFAINGPSRVYPGEKGICYRQGDLQAAFDGGSPLPGQRWGVRANQWTLSQGYPALITVHGVKNAANSILYGKFTPFRTVMGAPSYDLPAIAAGVPGSQIASVYAWDGTRFSAATPTTVFTAYNFAPVKIARGELHEFVEVEGLLVVPSPENYIWAATVTGGNIAAGTGGVVTLTDGRTPLAFNLGGSTVNNGDVVAVFQDRVNLLFFIVPLGSGATLVRFELFADLIYGTDPPTDNANVLVWDSGSSTYKPTGATIRVFDFSNDAYAGTGYGTWSGKGPVVSPALSGYQGWCILKPDRGVYEIVWMETPARFISFRLYQQLTTGNASQANVTVLSYWDGRNPDPTTAGITVYNLASDYSGVYKFAGDANAVGYAVWNEKLSHYQIVAIEGDGQRWLLVKNASGYTAPANSCVAVTGVTRDANGHTNNRNLLNIEKPSTTFHRNYLITGYADIPNNSVGVAFSTEGPMEATYDTGTPANGETWGPKPNQFTLSKGFPGFSVDGLNGDESLAVVRIEPIVQLLAQATAKLSRATTDSTHYKIYTGAQGSEADGGWSTLPTIEIRNEAIPSGAWFWMRWVNNGWEAEPMAGQGFERYIYGTTAATLTAGGSCACTVSGGTAGFFPGSSLTISDITGQFSGASGKRFLAAYNPLGDSYFFVWVSC